MNSSSQTQTNSLLYTESKRRVSKKASLFTESVIREMTREALKHGAVNLSQGFPDFAAPEDIKRAAMDGVAADINQYAITDSVKRLAFFETRRFDLLGVVIKLSNT